MSPEIWEKIKKYDNYKVSNCGNVLSVKRNILLRKSFTKNGYYKVRLYKNGTGKTFLVHQLVARTFLTDHGQTVNHKDYNKTNNHVSNLEYISQRENIWHSKKRLNSYSKYPGVSYWKKNKKWGATIFYNGKNRFIGLFDSEIDAKKEYDKKLSTINA